MAAKPYPIDWEYCGNENNSTLKLCRSNWKQTSSNDNIKFCIIKIQQKSTFSNSH